MNEVDNPRKKVTNSGIVPQMGRFHGLVEKGCGFLQSFKTMSEGMPGSRKMQVFSGLLEHKRCCGIWEPSLLLGKSWRVNSCKLGVLWCLLPSYSGGWQGPPDWKSLNSCLFFQVWGVPLFFQRYLERGGFYIFILKYIWKALKIHSILVKRAKLSWEAFLF